MEDNLKQAIRAIKSGNKITGRQMLAQIIKNNPQNEAAWLWMATVVADPLQKKQCLQSVLRYNPDNKIAKEGLARLEAEVSDTTPDESIEYPQLDDILQKKSIQPPQSSGGIVKGLADTLYGTPGKVESYKRKNPTKFILASGATKARKFDSGQPVNYQGLGWIFSRKGTLILTGEQLVCGDWQIPLSSIKEVSAMTINYIFSKGLILEIATYETDTYVFGLVYDAAWLKQKVLPIKVKPVRKEFQNGYIMLIIGPIVGIVVGYIFGYFAGNFFLGEAGLFGDLNGKVHSFIGIIQGLYVGAIVGIINTRMFGGLFGAIIGVVIGVIVAIIFGMIFSSAPIGGIIGIVAGITVGVALGK